MHKAEKILGPPFRLQLTQAGIKAAYTGVSLKGADRLAAVHGGKPKGWSKVKSSNHKHNDGFNQETHAYQNTDTGQLVEPKTSIDGHDKGRFGKE